MAKQAAKDTPKVTRAGRIAIVGRPNVGKSTLLNALVGEPIAITSSHPQTTRDRIAGILTRGGAQFVFLDTPGLHRPRTRLGARMNRQAREALEGADAIVFVTDVPREPVLRDVDKALLAELPAEVPVVLALNKVDRVAGKARLLPVLEAHARARDFAAVVPVSALRHDGTEGLLAEIEKLLPESPPLFEGDEVSDRPARFFVAELVREQILRRTREEVPHGIAVVVERWTERSEAKRPTTEIDLVVIVDKESHKKIVIGKGGAMLKAVGIDARARVEKLLGQHVHLRLWVRVSPGWYESDAKLRELGYGEGVEPAEEG